MFFSGEQQNVAVRSSVKLQRSFETLGLEVGQLLTVEAQHPKRKAQVQLLGYRSGHSLMISAPRKHSSEVLLEKDEPLALRFLTGRTACAFESRVLYHCYQPFSYYHISFPQHVESLEVRNATRVESNIFADVDSEFVLVGEWPKTVQLVNLSESGLCFRSDEFLGLLGHELLFTFEVPLEAQKTTLFVTGIIRNIDHPEPQSLDRHYSVGVEFVGLDERARLVLANYVLNKNTFRQSDLKTGPEPTL